MTSTTTKTLTTSKTSTDEPIFPENTLPIVAILRGAPLAEMEAIAETLIRSGIRIIEITLNTENALKSIELITKKYSDKATIGAGTVLNPEDVKNVHNAGGTFIVSPNTVPEVITKTKELKMMSIPGAMTPTEVFTALKHGADMVKIFPCFVIKPDGIRAIRAVLEPHTRLIPTGGVMIPQETSSVPDYNNEDTIYDYLHAGCWGVGLARNLYTPGTTTDELARRANRAVHAVRLQLEALKDKRHSSWD